MSDEPDLSKEPDLLIAPNGRTARSVADLTADEIDGFLESGWSRVTFEQHVADVSSPLVDAAIEQAIARAAEAN
jgi:hypothetical protein